MIVSGRWRTVRRMGQRRRTIRNKWSPPRTWPLAGPPSRSKTEWEGLPEWSEKVRRTTEGGRLQRDYYNYYRGTTTGGLSSHIRICLCSLALLLSCSLALLLTCSLALLLACSLALLLSCSLALLLSCCSLVALLLLSRSLRSTRRHAVHGQSRSDGHD